MIIAAPVWHFWIAPILVAGVFLTIITIIALYLKFVTSKQYPPRGRRQASNSQ